MYKMKFFILICSVFCIVNGCKREVVTNYKATLYNKSTVQVVILPYKNGVVYKADTIKIKINDSFLISDGWVRGKIETPFFNNEYFEGANDSTIVVFDNIYRVAHYFITPMKLNPKHILHKSERNIYNSNYYEFTREGSKRKGYTNIHKYYFT